MQFFYRLISVFYILFFVSSCREHTELTVPNVNWKQAENFYIENITKSILYIDELKKEGVNGNKVKSIFKNLRKVFKKAEPYASYLNPTVGHRVNGPALPIFKEDNGKTIYPVGLQKIEESIYEGGVSDAEFNREVDITRGMLINLKKNIEKRTLNPQRFFISIHQQLFRIISLAVTGFDTPISHLGIEETITSLESLKFVYDNSIRFLITKNNLKLDQEFRDNITKSIKYIKNNIDFDTFDRYTFIRDYMNPITRNWVDVRKESGLWEVVNTEVFNFDAPTFFENNSFNVNFFTPAINRNPNKKQIELGKKLFFDPNLSNSGKLACATCHIDTKGYADAKVFSLDNDGKDLSRNTPTLINSVFQKSFFWDGRSDTLLDQISSVFTNKKEFDSNVHQFSSEILKDTTYIRMFKDAFGGISSKNEEVIKAISSYISTLNGFNSKFDRNIRGRRRYVYTRGKNGF